eukprot:snap_masked-scaffold_3-processed-gene-13.6-mRNA-1 protein AED:1.00 eAED:1.00 QI:0/0/0/0/1/1/2/0/65
MNRDGYKRHKNRPLLTNSLVGWLNPSDVTIRRIKKVVKIDAYEVQNVESDEVIKVSTRNLIPLCF